MSPLDPAHGMDLWQLLGAVVVGLWLGGVLTLTRLRPVWGFAICAALWAIGDLIAGRATGVLVSFIVDLIWFPGSGHWVHGWA